MRLSLCRKCNSLVRRVVVAFILGSGTYALSACSTPPAKQEVIALPLPGDLSQQWGVQVVALRASAAGYLLDFRYRVTDADKAAPLLKQEAKAYLLVEKNGAQLYVPTASRVGPLRQSATKIYVDRNYFVLFANPGKLVQPGDRVTVVIGDFKVEHLTVNQS